MQLKPHLCLAGCVPHPLQCAFVKLEIKICSSNGFCLFLSIKILVFEIIESNQYHG